MISRLLSSILVAAVLIFATANGQAQTVANPTPASAPVVKIAAPGNLFALLEKSRPAGLMLETIDILLKQMGKIPSYITMPIGDALKKLQEGKLDMVSVVVPDPRLKEIAWISDPIVNEYNLVMTPKERVFPFSRVSDLYGKQIGARVGYQYPMLESNNSIKLIRFRSDGEMIRALLFGQIDAVLISAISDIFTFRTEGILDRFVILKTAVGTVPISVAFAKNRFSQEDVDSFNRALAQFKQQPEWNSLLDRNALVSLIKDWPLITQ